MSANRRKYSFDQISISRWLKTKPLTSEFFRQCVYIMHIKQKSKLIMTMRGNFFHLKEWYMTTERPEDFELVRDYVVKETRRVSLKQIGVDLTDE